MATIETSPRATEIDDLYRRHVADVYRYTYAVLGNHADAEDVTQTTFVNALRALERGEEPRNAGNWLLVIAHNLVRQRWRQAASRPAEVELVNDVPAATDESDIELDSLVRALQRIPPAQREALVMRELEGRSYREISELLSLSTSALESLLFRARRSLAEELENVVTCESAELAISKRLDGRLGRKERRRLAAHLHTCPTCMRLAQTQTRQRRAFKGLAVLPVPIGLALFKGAPTATAAVGLPTIGALDGGTSLAGTAGTGATATAFGSATAGGGAAAAGGGTLVGAAAAKVAAVVVAASVATGVGSEGIKAVRDTPSKPPATQTRSGGEKGSATTGAGGSAGRASAHAATPTPPVRARGTAAAPGRVKQADPPGTKTGQLGSGTATRSKGLTGESKGNSTDAHESATPARRRTGQTTGAERGPNAAGKPTGAQRDTDAATARERAAAKKLARDGATAGAAATGKPVKDPAEPTSQASTQSSKGKGPDAPYVAPPGTPTEPPSNKPDARVAEAARSGDTTDPGQGPALGPVTGAGTGNGEP